MAEVTQGEVTPAEVVPVVPAPEGAQTPDSGSPETPPGDKPPAPPEKAFSQKDVDRIVAKERRRLEAETRERTEYRVRAELAEKQLREAQGAPAKAQPEGKPQPGKYATPEEYIEAVTDWKIAEREKAREAQAATERKERDERDFNTSRVKSIMKGSEKYDDFRERVFADDYEMTDAMIASASETKTPADVVYYLSQHPEEASRIAALPTTLQAYEIHALASKVAAPPATTKAPAPITPQTGTASVEKRLEDAEYDDFVKIRRKQIAAKHGRT